MLPKPDHLGPAYATQFADPSVVATYHLRPPYPAEVFDVLAGLVVDEPRSVLDAGCGTGEIARRLGRRVARVDGVDPSSGMLAQARALPGGDAKNLAWILGRAEDAPLRPPYALVIAAASLHWMDWAVVLPRFRDFLTPRGVLAVVDQRQLSAPWDAGVHELIEYHSTNRDYRPYDLIDELERRRLFRPLGSRETSPVPFEQRLDDYVKSFHSRNGLSRDRMEPSSAAAFDRDLTALVAPHAPNGVVRFDLVGSVVWGSPAPCASS